MADKMEIEVLDDGTLKISTDQISTANHTNAEGLQRELIKVSGGEVDRQKKAGMHYHEHGGVYHSH